MDKTDFISQFQKVLVKEYPTQAPSHPLVSVCVQTYQHVGFIRECLDGILMQKTDFPFEVLLGEDDSIDGTREICLEYSKKFPEKIRLFLHHRVNNISIGEKPTGRFNFVYNLINANGKYIALCEGDDYWTDPLKLQKQVDFLDRNNNYFLVGHQALKYFGPGCAQNKVIGKFNKDNFSFNEIAGKNLRIPTGSIMFRNQLEYPKWIYQVYGGDRALIFLCAKKGKLKVLDFCGSIYRIHEGGIDQGYKKDKFSLPIRNIIEDKIYYQIVERQHKKALAKKISWNYLYLSIQYGLKGGINKSVTNFLFSLVYYCRSI